MSKSKIKEAMNYGGLSQQEIGILNSAPANIRKSVSNVISALSKGGRQVSLNSVVQQMAKMPQFANDAEFANFSSVAGLSQIKKADPFQLKNNIPKPLDFNQVQRQKIAQELPSGETLGDKYEQLRTSKETNSDIENEKIRSKQMQTRKNIPGRTLMGIGDIAESKTIKEFMNPAIAGSLQGIMSAISKLKPDQLAAIVQMVNSLMQSKPGAAMASSSSTRMESKKMTNKKMITEAVKVTLKEQVDARNTAQTLLEGPLANVWDKLKGAGSAIGQKMGIGGAPQQQMPGADDRSKQASQELTKIIGKINQYRQKFNSSILKNSESMNGYHDLVMNAVQMYNQSQGVLGPFGAQISRQIQDSVGNLVYDLKSEKDQIDTFLNTLKQAGLQNVPKKSAVGGKAMINPGFQGGFDSDQLGNNAQTKANIRRAQENPGAVGSNKRAVPFDLTQNQAKQNLNNFYSQSMQKKAKKKKK